MVVLHHVVEHDIAALDGIVGMDAGIIEGGGLEHTHEHGRLFSGQLFGGDAKVGLGSRFDAKGVGAEVDGVGILCQYFLLSEEVL